VNGELSAKSDHLGHLIIVEELGEKGNREKINIPYYLHRTEKLVF